jgi:spermidine/putrescine transport system permease protein
MRKQELSQGQPLFWILPALIWLALCIGLPLLIILVVSFARREAYGGIQLGLSLSNYARAFETLYGAIYFRSLLLASLTTGLCLILAFPVAYFMALQKSPAAKNLLLFLVTLPFWTSFLIRTYAWVIILRAEGLINSLLLNWGLLSTPLNLLYNNFAILIGLVYGELPFMILPLYTALEKMEKSLLEASADLGCSPWNTFVKVLVPLSRHGIWAGAILVFIPSLGAFITPDLLGGAKTMMLGNLIQSQFAVVRDQPFGSALAFLLTTVVLLLLAVSYRAAKRGAEERIF